MKKFLLLLLSVFIMLLCACSAKLEQKAPLSDDAKGVASEIPKNTPESYGSYYDAEEDEEYIYIEGYGYMARSEYDKKCQDTEEKISKLPEDSQYFISLLNYEDYTEICNYWCIDEEFPEECAMDMMALAIDGVSVESILSDYFDSYTPFDETADEIYEEKTFIVYVTKSGAKYHSAGCTSLQKSCIEIDLSVAKSKGYTPCKNCW